MSKPLANFHADFIVDFRAVMSIFLLPRFSFILPGLGVHVHIQSSLGVLAFSGYFITLLIGVTLHLNISCDHWYVPSRAVLERLERPVILAIGESSVSHRRQRGMTVRMGETEFLSSSY
nr:hypothetical protein Iba_chr06aCG10710 [Ipomoea batatas]